jgi:hypothetical protein
MTDVRAVEEELLKILQFGGLKKENLASLVKIVAGFSAKGMQHIKVFPKGIPPEYEGLEVKSVVEAGQLNGILSTILKESQVSSVIIFPYGVPVYDYAELAVGLGPAPIIGAAAGSEAVG